MSNQSYSEQIGWCNTTLDKLKDLEYSLKSAVGDVNATFNYLKSSVLMQEDFDTIKGFDDVIIDKAKELYLQLQNDNVVYIDAQLNLLNQMAGNTPPPPPPPK